jgi:hypothetical protein
MAVGGLLSWLNLNPYRYATNYAAYAGAGSHPQQKMRPKLY